MPRPTRAALVHRPSETTLVDEAVEHLQSIWRHGLLQTVIAVGDYLIDRFFDGSLEGAASFAPTKPAALNRLMLRAPEIGVSRHQLRVAVRIAVQYRQLPPAVAAGLSVSHHELLLVVPLEDKLRLARAALKEALTRRAFQQLIRRKHPAHPGGRPPSPQPVVWLRSLERAMSEVAMVEALAEQAVRALPEGELRRLETSVRRARDRLDGVLAVCARRGKRLPVPRP